MSLLLATAGTPASSTIASEGVDFDGTNDYLSRSSDLVGNVDSKTFTFSAWAYFTVTGTNQCIYSSNQNNTAGYYGFHVVMTASGEIAIQARVQGATTLQLNVYNATSYAVPYNTWINILISFDTSSTSNRYVYINDIDYTSSMNFQTYTVGALINFSSDGGHQVGDGYMQLPYRVKGRLSNLFLDYTYRDLSIEANRRLFITADGKPA